jgi:propionyl-CoA carboxylase alpha chain
LSAIRKLLVANRAEIARRVFRTCEALGIATAAVYEEADRDAPHVRDAGEAVRIASYLSIAAIVDAARRVGADAIHPGYGFLAENADFAEACLTAGLTLVGPRPETVRAMGSKIEARKIAITAGLPVIPTDGFPLLVKAAAGGGGKGMRRVDRAEHVSEAMAAARREAESAFGDGTLLVERYLEGARHIEVQIFGDGHGKVVDLFERECSLQRRYQKIIEESPAPGLGRELRNALCDAAVKLGSAINYTGAGTVEFLLAPSGEFYFLEVNTRIQVEHPVTELLTGLDLVRMQIEVAEGRGLDLQPVHASGHAIEARLYAEDPANGFLPSSGKILAWRPPSGVRVDSGIETGSEIGIAYDPLLAKIIAHGRDREEAIRRLRHALASTVIHGVTTNREYLMRVLDHADFPAGRVHTGWSMPFEPDRSEEAQHRAALDAYIAARRQSERKILPEVRQGWRNNPWPPLLTASVRVDVIACEPGALRAEIDGVQLDFLVSEDDRTWWINTYTFPKVSRYPASESAAAGESSPMPGKVLRVLVEKGAAVQAGDALVILEAMKMEQTVRAHAAGHVAAILVKPGDVVAPGQTLIQMGE